MTPARKIAADFLATFDQDKLTTPQQIEAVEALIDRVDREAFARGQTAGLNYGTATMERIQNALMGQKWPVAS